MSGGVRTVDKYSDTARTSISISDRMANAIEDMSFRLREIRLILTVILFFVVFIGVDLAILILTGFGD
jgi:hypothetical protein